MLEITGPTGAEARVWGPTLCQVPVASDWQAAPAPKQTAKDGARGRHVEGGYTASTKARGRSFRALGNEDD